jgi:vacuolar iron transporter family protein
VLGANDGLLSTSSLVLGVAASHGNRNAVVIEGIAGLVAGSMSMAAGEFVSVHSQADTEAANLDLERTELWIDNNGKHRELAAIYVGLGIDPQLAKQVADQLMAHRALGSHARDKLGISETPKAQPLFPRPALRLARRCHCSSPRLLRTRRY